MARWSLKVLFVGIMISECKAAGSDRSCPLGFYHSSLKTTVCVGVVGTWEENSATEVMSVKNMLDGRFIPA